LSLFLNSLFYWRGGFSDVTIQEQLQAALVHSEHRISVNSSNIGVITGLASHQKGSPLKGTEEWRVNAVIREKKVLCRNYFITSRTAMICSVLDVWFESCLGCIQMSFVLYIYKYVICFYDLLYI
jgi:hypothetical protein